MSTNDVLEHVERKDTESPHRGNGDLSAQKAAPAPGGLSAALERLRAKGGAVTVNTTDHLQRNLLIALDRMVCAGTAVRVLIDGPLATYRLRQ